MGIEYIAAAYAALQQNGASLPAKCNAANLAGCIGTVSATLGALRAALNDGSYKEKFPLGAQVYDEWDGKPDPWIVVSHAGITSGGVSYPGVRLMRYFVSDEEYVFDTATNVYADSSIFQFLNGEYYQKCSAEVKKYAISFTNTSGVPAQRIWLPTKAQLEYGTSTQFAYFSNLGYIYSYGVSSGTSLPMVPITRDWHRGGVQYMTATALATHTVDAVGASGATVASSVDDKARIRPCMAMRGTVPASQLPS